jgi:hypothetical protein
MRVNGGAGFAACGPAFQRDQPAESRPQAGMPTPLWLFINHLPDPEPALARNRLSSSGVKLNMYRTSKSA